jgi:hypothetical protein
MRPVLPAPLSLNSPDPAFSGPERSEGRKEAARNPRGFKMTRIEFLTRRWYEVDQLRYKKLAEIRALTGDDSWIRRRNIPGNALHAISEWVDLCRMLAVLGADIQRERQNPQSSEMVVH